MYTYCQRVLPTLPSLISDTRRRRVSRYEAERKSRGVPFQARRNQPTLSRGDNDNDNEDTDRGWIAFFDYIVAACRRGKEVTVCVTMI